MLMQCERALEVLQTKFTDVNLDDLSVFHRIRRLVPRVHFVTTKLNHLQPILLIGRTIALDEDKVINQVLINMMVSVNNHFPYHAEDGTDSYNQTHLSLPS